MDEYDKSGMIHISEISPGRIRNIGDYVQEGKKIVCKVLRLDTEKGHVDLSLRRVNVGERRKKLDQIKQEQLAEKIIELVAQELKKKPKSVYEEIVSRLGKEYDAVHPFFIDIVTESINMSDYGFSFGKELEEAVRLRIKPPTVIIGGDIVLQSYTKNGVEIIRDLLKKAMKKANDTTVLKYVGAGKYSLRITAPDYKEAELLLKKITSVIVGSIPKAEGVSDFLRKEIKS